VYVGMGKRGGWLRHAGQRVGRGGVLDGVPDQIPPDSDKLSEPPSHIFLGSV
jgi:hypothetical protein